MTSVVCVDVLIIFRFVDSRKSSSVLPVLNHTRNTKTRKLGRQVALLGPHLQGNVQTTRNTEVLEKWSAYRGVLNLKPYVSFINVLFKLKHNTFLSIRFNVSELVTKR